MVGCVKSTPPADVKPVPDAGVSEADLVAPKLDAIEKEVAELVQRSDDVLWKHWTLGAPLDLPGVFKGHDALLSKDTLNTLERARTLRPLDAERIDALSRWVTAELLVRGTATESEALANLEAATNFQLDGKDVPLRDLGKTLLSEKSAVKRRAVWAASHEAVHRIEEAIVARERKLTELLTSLGLPGPLEYAAHSRGLDLVKLEELANTTLTETDAEWKATLQRLADGDLKLPVAQLTRGDLPRLLRVPAALDGEFPKQKIATRLVQTLGTLGLYGKAGLTLDLAESAKKNPLPLTVAPKPDDVRVSIRPLGGLRDQSSALSELGTAVALFNAREQPLWKGRLAAPLAAQVSAEQFANKLLDREWLTANEVKDVDGVIAAAKAQRLFTLRRSAGLVLARLEAARAQDEETARVAFVGLMSRALGFTLAPEEGVRWRYETDDFLRNASQLMAAQRP